VGRAFSETDLGATYLLFAVMDRGRLDFYHGLPVTPGLVPYVRGLLEREGRPEWEVLHHCALHLGDADPAVAVECAREFSRASHRDILAAGRQLDPALPRRWLGDKQTRPEQLGLFALLLAGRGQQQDADLVRPLVERLASQDQARNLDLLLVAYTLQRPREGWDCVRRVAAEKARPFMARYACLRAARFLRDDCPAVLAWPEIRAVLEAELEDPEMADLAVHQLVRWQAWELTPRVLALAGRPGFGLPIVQRSVLLYALQCPDPAAAGFVADQQAKDPERVQKAKELLQILQQQ
jgi:hypothetical protein